MNYEKYKESLTRTELKAYEKTCLNAVDAVLRDYVPSTCYSIGSAKESAACIEKENSGWVVYDYERGNRFDINSYDNIVEACLDLIRRVGGKAQSAKLIDIFLSDVIRGDDIQDSDTLEKDT